MADKFGKIHNAVVGLLADLHILCDYPSSEGSKMDDSISHAINTLFTSLEAFQQKPDLLTKESLISSYREFFRNINRFLKSYRKIHDKIHWNELKEVAFIKKQKGSKSEILSLKNLVTSMHTELGTQLSRIGNVGFNLFQHKAQLESSKKKINLDGEITLCVKLQDRLISELDQVHAIIKRVEGLEDELMKRKEKAMKEVLELDY